MERILKDSKLLEGSDSIEGFFTEYETNLISKFYSNPLDFNKEESLEMVNLLNKLDHNDFKDFTLMTILKYDLLDIGRCMLENEELFEIANDKDVDILAIQHEYVISIIWLKENGKFSNEAFIEALQNGKFVDFLGLENCDEDKDSILFYANKSRNLELIKSIWEMYGDFDETTKIAIFDNSLNSKQKMEFILSKFQPDEIHVLSAIVNGIKNITIQNLKILIQKYNLNDKDFINAIFTKCCEYERIDLVDYLSEIATIDILNDENIIESYQNNFDMLEWIYSKNNNRNKFIETLRNTSQFFFSKDVRCYNFCTTLGIEYGVHHIFLYSALICGDVDIIKIFIDKVELSEDDIRKFAILFRPEISKLFYKFNPTILDEDITQIIQYGDLVLLKSLYENGLIEKIKNENFFNIACEENKTRIAYWLLEFQPEISREIRLKFIKTCSYETDANFLIKTCSDFELTNKERYEIVKMCIISKSLPAFRFFTNNGTLELKNKQALFNKAINESTFSIAKFIFKMGGVEFDRNNLSDFNNEFKYRGESKEHMYDYFEKMKNSRK